MKNQLSYVAYRCGWALIGVLPSRIAYALFAWIADIAYKRNGKGVQRLRANYRVVKPALSEDDLEALVRRGMRSYMRYWCDTFRIHRWSSQKISNTVTTNRDEYLRSPMREGKGVVIAIPHSGNWDHAGAYFCQEGFPLVTVAEVLKPEKLFQKFVEHRTRMGFEVLPLENRTFISLMRKARDKRLIALVADRDLSDSGVEVDFFGKRAKMPAGPALLAIKEGIPLAAAVVRYTSHGIHIDFFEVEVSQLDFESDRVKATVQNMANAFAQGIAEQPEDWHMLQKIWIDSKVYA